MIPDLRPLPGTNLSSWLVSVSADPSSSLWESTAVEDSTAVGDSTAGCFVQEMIAPQHCDPHISGSAERSESQGRQMHQRAEAPGPRLVQL